MTTGKPTVIDIIQQYAPRQWRINGSSQRNHYSMSCPYPNHDDQEHRDHGGSFSVDVTREKFFCFGCGQNGGAETLRQALSGDTPLPARVTTPAASRAPKKRDRKPLQGASIQALALSKGLDPEFLKDSMGWSDDDYYGTPAVRIPYQDRDNNNAANRFRVGVDSSDRFRWEQGAIPSLYGLHTIDWIHENFDYVYMVEGETDYAMLSQHGLPVIASPGAAVLKRDWGKLLIGLDVYVWREPDAGGDTFIEKMQTLVPGFYQILAPQGVKDACDLGAVSDNLPATMDVLRQRATRVGSEVADSYLGVTKVAVPDAQLGFEDPRAGVYGQRRDRVVSGYVYSGDRKAATKVSRCALWRQGDLWDCGTTEGLTWHCHVRGCPNCTRSNLRLMFVEKHNELSVIESPQIMEFPEAFMAPYPEENDDACVALMRSEKSKAVKLLSDWTKYAGKTNDVAKNNLYTILQEISDGVLRTGFALFFDRMDSPTAWLERHGIGVAKTRYFPSIEEAYDYFSHVVATGFTWEDDRQFYLWSYAMKGLKLVQGKGRFSKIAGGKPKTRAPKVHSGICPVHGVEEGRIKQILIGPPTSWQPVRSQWTGKIHYLLIEGAPLSRNDEEDYGAAPPG